MKKLQLARRLARKSGLSQAEAADELDRVIHRIVAGLRKGQPVPLSGLGRFRPDRGCGVQFEPDPPKRGPKNGE